LHHDGVHAFSEGDFEEALRLFRQAGLLAPDNMEILKDVGHAHLHLGHRSQAHEAYDRAWEGGARYVDLAFNLALLCLDQGDETKAQRLLHTVADQDFRVRPGRHYLGLIYPSTSVFMAECLLFLGLAARARSEQVKAIEHLLRAIDLNPQLISAHQALADCFVALKRWPEAIEKCREILEMLPAGEVMAATGVSLAHALFESGNVADATRELLHVLEHEPEHPGALAQKRLFEERLGKPLAPRARREVDAAEVASPLFGLSSSRGLTPDLDDSGLVIIGKSQAMYHVLRKARLAAASNSTVLLTGENGTGKELIARAIYLYSPRRNRPFIPVNCAALPETLLESELFGHERGSFTGAHAQKKGRFELADGGTLFLDEVGEMSLALQVKLLRVLQEKEFVRVGGTETLHVDVRIIAATNQNVERRVREKSFREDLYYRLNVLPINVPPLQERREDIPLLVDHFLRQHSGAGRGPPRTLTPEEMEILMDHSWPGNVRELENFIERACVMGHSGPQLIEEIHRLHRREIADHSHEIAGRFAVDGDMTLDELERAFIDHVLQSVDGNQKRAAEMLGINPSTLWRRLKRYHREGGAR
jgi:DNA-binding NtrC family response regulator/Flp pilus assembly protein TadD